MLELLLVVELARRGGALSRAAVSEALAVDAAELSRLINRAEEAELVFRRSEMDRRRVTLELLDRGWDMAEEALSLGGGAVSGNVAAETSASGGGWVPASDAGLSGETLVARCLVVNKQLRIMRRDYAITFAQAVCLRAVAQLNLRPEDPSAATQIERLTGVCRTTARTALSRLIARGFFG